MLMKYHPGRLARPSLCNAENYFLRLVIAVTGARFWSSQAVPDVAAILWSRYILCVGDDP
jgi:hypothetical protein